MPKQITNVASDDALTTIYRLAHDDRDEVIAARISERLGVKPASVAGMLSRLKRDDLVRVDSRKRISLTADGTRRAEQMVRRHRLAECLLVEVLSLEWWLAYEEAHLLEHSISDLTEPLILERLGHPVASPFGYPIPGVDGAPPLSSRRLLDLRAGDASTVERVYEEDEALLRFFAETGIRPGAEIEVTEVAAYRGTVTVRVGDAEVVIGLETARRIWVAEQ